MKEARRQGGGDPRGGGIKEGEKQAAAGILEFGSPGYPPVGSPQAPAPMGALR
jgi:hypothetical protein